MSASAAAKMKAGEEGASARPRLPARPAAGAFGATFSPREKEEHLPLTLRGKVDAPRGGEGRRMRALPHFAFTSISPKAVRPKRSGSYMSSAVAGG